MPQISRADPDQDPSKTSNDHGMCHPKKKNNGHTVES